jgi:hypothetical protein
MEHFHIKWFTYMYHTTIAALCGMHLVDITVTAVGAVAAIEVTIEVCALPMRCYTMSRNKHQSAPHGVLLTAPTMPTMPTMCRTAE